MPSIQSTPIDLTKDAKEIQNTCVGDGLDGRYGSYLVRIVLWLFDNREYNKFLDNDFLACIEQAHISDRGKNQIMKLRTVIKSHLVKVTSEDPNNKHGSPINLEVGDDGITWEIVRHNAINSIYTYRSH